MDVKLKVAIFCITPEETPSMTSYAITAGAIEHYADALAQFEHLLSRLTDEEAQRAPHGELEAMVQAEGNELLRRLIQGHLDQRGHEEPVRERVVGADGVARTHRREGCTRCPLTLTRIDPPLLAKTDPPKFAGILIG